MRCIRGSILKSSTNLTAVKPVQHVAQSKHRADGITQQCARCGGSLGAVCVDDELIKKKKNIAKLIVFFTLCYIT